VHCLRTAVRTISAVVGCEGPASGVDLARYGVARLALESVSRSLHDSPRRSWHEGKDALLKKHLTTIQNRRRLDYLTRTDSLSSFAGARTRKPTAPPSTPSRRCDRVGSRNAIFRPCMHDRCWIRKKSSEPGVACLLLSPILFAAAAVAGILGAYEATESIHRTVCLADPTVECLGLPWLRVLLQATYRLHRIKRQWDPQRVPAPTVDSRRKPDRLRPFRALRVSAIRS